MFLSFMFISTVANAQYTKPQQDSASFELRLRELETSMSRNETNIIGIQGNLKKAHKMHTAGAITALAGLALTGIGTGLFMTANGRAEYNAGIATMIGGGISMMTGCGIMIGSHRYIGRASKQPTIGIRY